MKLALRLCLGTSMSPLGAGNFFKHHGFFERGRECHAFGDLMKATELLPRKNCMHKTMPSKSLHTLEGFIHTNQMSLLCAPPTPWQRTLYTWCQIILFIKEKWHHFFLLLSLPPSLARKNVAVHFPHSPLLRSLCHLALSLRSSTTILF